MTNTVQQQVLKAFIFFMLGIALAFTGANLGRHPESEFMAFFSGLLLLLGCVSSVYGGTFVSTARHDLRRVKTRLAENNTVARPERQ